MPGPKIREESHTPNPTGGAANDIKGAETLWKGDPTEVIGTARIEGRFGQTPSPPIKPEDKGLPGRPNDID